ncbi:MAG: dipeptidase [Pseudomonadales bacterium]|nr:dipeptidase [Pseudomonadales bacterium]
MQQLSQVPTLLSSRTPLALILAGALLAGCGGGGGGSTAASNSEQPRQPDSEEPPTNAPDPGPEPAPEPLNRYQFANGCYTLQSQGQYLQAQPNAARYGLTGDADQATAFYLKPTDLGRYLLLSDYQRATGSPGEKQLLGISDPAGEFLDQSGNFVGELSYLVAGLGDTLNLVLDPVAPLGGLLRELGESLDGIGGNLGDANIQPTLAMVDQASDLAVWNLNRSTGDTFTLASQVTGLLLTASDENLTLTSPGLASAANRFTLSAADGCAPYPEAELGATVQGSGPANYLTQVDRFRDVPGIDDDDIFGFVDAHSHISAYEFIGGRINYGDPFHKFGVDHALHDCAENHGPQGMTGLLEQVTSTPGPHDTRGWPDFPYWPRHNSLQHHQSYYRWIERAHLAGLKVLVNHLVHNEILCQLNPQKQNDCDTMASIEMQAELMHDMQDYIDAQHGGPGKGWFRIVTSPAQARQVIGDGKMAVILGVEASKALNCGEFLGVAECSREEIVDRLDRLYAMDVRSLFPVHKFDNAFGGHLPDLSSGIGIGAILYGGNLLETGHPIEFEECPEHDHAVNDNPLANPLQPYGIFEQLLFQIDYVGDRFPASPDELADYDPRRGTDHLCNTRGLTDLGFFLIEELTRRGMMIETDHISRKAATQILDLTAPRGYPVVNSHGGWGGTEALRDRVAEQGGITASFGGVRDDWVDKLTRDGNRPRPDNYKVGPFGGAAFASDVNGIANLAGNPGTPEQEADLYPFTSVDGRVVFDKQVTGDHAFSLYEGRGVAHYGLYPDQIADMVANSDRPEEQVNDAVNQLFTSAEAYIRMWERLEQAAR